MAFILYADKTKLTSFGKAMGYPVYARIANFNTSIRNTNSIGGGELVGWLPIVGHHPRYWSLEVEITDISIYRSQKMRQRKVKRTTWISNVLSGTDHFSNCLNLSQSIQQQAAGWNVEIKFKDNYSL